MLPLFYKEFCKIREEMPYETFELILVDDGSKDRTLSLFKELRANDADVKYLSFSRNFGKEAAIYAGLENSKGDYAVDGITAFSTAPLVASAFAGVLFSLCAFAAMIFIIVRKFIFGDPVAGWASTATIILFVGGVQMFFMGIMGQYLAKTYLEGKKRPIYICAEKAGLDE